MKCSNLTKMFNTENQHTVKVQRQNLKAYMYVEQYYNVTVQFLPSGEHKNYDHIFNFKFYKY